MAGLFVPLGEQREELAEIEAIPTRDKVISLINEAQIVGKGNKIACLNQVKELIINKDPELLDSFLDEVIAFQQDGSPEVRKFVVTFMEEACKCDMGLLVRVVPIVAYMMEDESTIVLKRLLSCVIQIYRLAILHIIKVRVIDSSIKEMWEMLSDIKQKVRDKLDSDNDGVRTIVLKFMEILILCQTKKEANSEPPKSTDIDLSLDMIPGTHSLLDAGELREEAGTIMGSLLEMTVSPVITSVNLMTCIISLATIAKQRPSYITIVVQAYELLHGNLPPHFSPSQISSVRKQLKTQILSVLRQPSSFQCREQILTLLTDLGCTQSEIAKNTPKMSQSAKAKKPRIDPDSVTAVVKSRERSSSVMSGSSTVPSSAMRPSGERGAAEDKPAFPGQGYMEAIEMTTNDLKSLLTPEVVTELVISNMRRVPSIPPSTFVNSYTPIAAAGTESQVKHLARLLASQMTQAGIGVGAESKGIKPQRESDLDGSPVVSDPRKRRREQKVIEEEESRRSKRPKHEFSERELDRVKVEEKPLNLEESMAQLSYLGTMLGLPNIMDPMFPVAYATFFKTHPDAESALSVKTSNLVSIPTTPDEEDKKEKEKRKLQATLPQKLKKIRKFDIGTFAKPLDPKYMDNMKVLTFRRILESDKNFVIHGGKDSQARIKLIVNLVTLFKDFNHILLEFILEDLRGRFELAMAWLYSKYSGHEAPGSIVQSKEGLEFYNICLVGLLEGARANLPPKDRLFSRLVLEAPHVTLDALAIIMSYCNDEERAFLGISTLKELILRRPQGPGGHEDFLNALLEITVSDIELARIQAMHIAKKFYSKPDLVMRIERFALQKLQLLLHDHPMFEDQLGDMGVTTEWTDSSVKVCFGLFVTLLPINPRLLRDLSFVYTSTTSVVKRIILRQLDQPIRSIGMNSPDLLALVENCPQGAETLIMRMLHIVTEGGAPSPELVRKVRELYRQNSSDARFLIPVIHGLTKQEVVAALPAFIKLTPTLVKGVFDRLLVLQGGGEHGHSMSPITPSELLIALHNVDCSNQESLMKCVIKASNLCFQEKTVFSQEVLAVVIQQLLDQDPIPVLFMRTVLQSLSAYPKLMSFVMTILSKLITKQVWKQSKVWQGFIKCAEMTKPHSLPVLLQLPPQQMDNLLKVSPGMAFSLKNHVQKLPPHQLANVQRSMLQVLERYSDLGAAAMTKEKLTKKVKKRRQSSKSEKTDKDQTPTESQENGTPAPE